ncbi:MAG: flagellar hook basal-body protein [Phycisphaeraceae bacterium]|nr:flagellar hook basal-body protein [Phycisphaeraceae bacterium]MCW5769541.1 flagellar hook basal-body protein [Phycisphaeraceae bacterium]
MNYGTQLSLSGVLTSLHKQDVATNNLANLNTTGFKTEIAMTRQRASVRIEDGLGSMPSDSLIERLGAGVMLAPTMTSHKQGSVMPTGNDLDIAIEGDGFLVVRDASDASSDRVRLTRDGRLARGASGLLVQVATGLPVLDTTNRTISLGDGPVQIDDQGLVTQNGEERGRIALVDVPDRRALHKSGDGLYVPDAASIAGRTSAAGRIRQRALEASTVDEIDALTKVTSAAREVSANLGMIQYQDRFMDRAINVLGRVS